MENYKVLGNRVLVEAILKKQTDGGVYVSDNVQDRPQQGKVILVNNNPFSEIKINDIVIFAKYSGTEIILNNQEYLIINIDDILMIL
jgi:chaperonin GroES